ncbi:hypothetical protein WDU94_004099 [Cyamophila willieti]
MVPDIPEGLEFKIKRERYLAKQALQDSETIINVATGLVELPTKYSRMVLDLTAELGGLSSPPDNMQESRTNPNAHKLLSGQSGSTASTTSLTTVVTEVKPVLKPRLTRKSATCNDLTSKDKDDPDKITGTQTRSAKSDRRSS